MKERKRKKERNNLLQSPSTNRRPKSDNLGEFNSHSIKNDAGPRTNKSQEAITTLGLPEEKVPW